MKDDLAGARRVSAGTAGYEDATGQLRAFGLLVALLNLATQAMLLLRDGRAAAGPRGASTAFSTQRSASSGLLIVPSGDAADGAAASSQRAEHEARPACGNRRSS
jgi:hypothetical protein